MKTVIYKHTNFQIVKVTDEDVDVSQLKDDEDFMPVSMWNSSDDKDTFPII